MKTYSIDFVIFTSYLPGLVEKVDLAIAFLIYLFG